MSLPNIFSTAVSETMIKRIERLQGDTPAKWGKMSADQMLAHCNVTYELALEDKHPKPNAFTVFMMKLFVKNIVVSEKPYSHNSRTAPVFLVTDHKNFEEEKKRLIAYVNKIQTLGEQYFDGKASHSFGKLNKTEWNNLFYKHLDHHLSQFGA